MIGIAKKRGMKVVEKDCTLEDFKGADEAFATGTAAGIIAIAEIDGVKVGDGREGRFTHELRGAYNEQVTPENLTPVPDVTKKFGDLKPADYQDLSTGFNEAYRKAMGKLAKKARKEAARKA